MGKREPRRTEGSKKHEEEYIPAAVFLQHHLNKTKPLPETSSIDALLALALRRQPQACASENRRRE